MGRFSKKHAITDACMKYRAKKAQNKRRCTLLKKAAELAELENIVSVTVIIVTQAMEEKMTFGLIFQDDADLTQFTSDVELCFRHEQGKDDLGLLAIDAELEPPTPLWLCSADIDHNELPFSDGMLGPWDN